MDNKLLVVESLIDAWIRGDVDGVLDCLCDDVEYHYLVGQRPLVGKEWVRRFLEKFGHGMSDIKWKILNHASNDKQLLVEGIDDYVDDKGVRVQTPYMGIFEFNDGLIYRWRDYVDSALINRAKAGEPSPDWLEPLLG